MCSNAEEGSGCCIRRGGVRWVQGGGGGVGTQIVAAFDLKVASPLLVLRDPWRTRLALI